MIPVRRRGIVHDIWRSPTCYARLDETQPTRRASSTETERSSRDEPSLSLSYHQPRSLLFQSPIDLHSLYRGDTAAAAAAAAVAAMTSTGDLRYGTNRICKAPLYVARSHPEMVGDMRYVACDFELWPIKNFFCALLARVKTNAHTKNETYTFTGSHLRAVTDADDDNDDDDANNAGRHSTTTRATYR